MHADLPSPDGFDSGSDADEAVERLLRSLPMAGLPPDWRSTILNQLPAPPPPTRFLTRKFLGLMAGIWGLTAAFYFTTPAPVPIPEGAPPPSSSRYPQAFPQDAGISDPRLAGNDFLHIHYYP